MSSICICKKIARCLFFIMFFQTVLIDFLFYHKKSNKRSEEETCLYLLLWMSASSIHHTWVPATAGSTTAPGMELITFFVCFTLLAIDISTGKKWYHRVESRRTSILTTFQYRTRLSRLPVSLANFNVEGSTIHGEEENFILVGIGISRIDPSSAKVVIWWYLHHCTIFSSPDFLINCHTGRFRYRWSDYRSWRCANVPAVRVIFRATVACHTRPKYPHHYPPWPHLSSAQCIAVVPVILSSSLTLKALQAVILLGSTRCVKSVISFGYRCSSWQYRYWAYRPLMVRSL